MSESATQEEMPGCVCVCVQGKHVVSCVGIRNTGEKRRICVVNCGGTCEQSDHPQLPGAHARATHADFNRRRLQVTRPCRRRVIAVACPFGHPLKTPNRCVALACPFSEETKVKSKTLQTTHHGRPRRESKSSEKCAPSPKRYEWLKNCRAEPEVVGEVRNRPFAKTEGGLSSLGEKSSAPLPIRRRSIVYNF